MKIYKLIIHFISFILLFNILISCNNIEKDWQKATITNSMESYSAFIKKYPKSEYDSIAYSKLSDFDWEKTTVLNSIEGYKNFIKEYPKSKYESIANSKLSDLEWKIKEENYVLTELPPIHIAAYQCKNDIIQSLILKKANINEKGSDDSTPLHWAALVGCLDVIKTLIDNGADINSMIETPMTIVSRASNDNKAIVFQGRESLILGTPLHWAAERNKIDAVQLLLDKGANVNSVTKWGISPLHYAANSGNEKMVDLLLKRGAKINDNRYTYCQPIHYSKNKAVISILLSNGAKLNSRSDNAGLPIHMATSMGYKEAVEFYLENGVDVNSLGLWSCGILGWGANVTPLWTAAYVGNFEMFKFLESKGGNINFKTNEKEIGGSVLHAAAWGGNVDLLKYLISKVDIVDINATIPSLVLMSASWENITPLGVACHYGNLDAVKVLMEAGADKNYKINGDWSPITVAMRSNKTEVVKYLLERSAKFEFKLDEIDNLNTSDEIKQIFKEYLNKKSTNYVLK